MPARATPYMGPGVRRLNNHMCGLAGFLTACLDVNEAERTIRGMTDRIAHRGPDDSGVWMDRDAGVVLGHRRLSIIDLSPAGHQPMASATGRYVLVYNGEIYNHRRLRAQLEQAGSAPAWRGHSDTEVLLACIEAWGVRGALAELNGMFALALWDRQDRVLTLARDRAGEKPLYYGRQGSSFLFASELKAITAHPEFERVIDRAAVSAFMRYGYVPSPACIWTGLRKLGPGQLLQLRPGEWDDAAPETYWNLGAIADRAAAAPAMDHPGLVDELDGLLRDAVALRMEADVPLGAFLSGGIDSSTVTALMQVQSSRPVRTFSIGFSEAGYDESGHARAVAEHLGTDHTELRVSPAEARDVLPRIPEIWDEPFADSSQIPTFLVSALARKHVTVALTGDGGDELFAGYNRHVLGARIWSVASTLPGAARRGLAAALSAPVTGTVLQRLASTAGLGRRVAGLAERLPKIGTAVAARNPSDLYERLVTHWPADATPVLGAADRSSDKELPAFADFRNAMLYLDTMTYLPDDILTKVDRAGMAVSLEGRIPFLDHRVIEFAWQIPLSAKIRNGRGKDIVRQVLHRYVPPMLVDRPKAGFAVPIGDWLRGPLKDWAEALIDPRQLAGQAVLDVAAVTDLWKRFLGGDSSLLTRVWCVLMFQAWLAEQGGTVQVSALRKAA